MRDSSAVVIVDWALPERRTALAGLALDFLAMAAAAAFIALLAQVRVVLPFTPVPLTGQTLGVLVSGMALGMRRGSGAALLYLVCGGLGLPVFSGFGAGAAHLSGPTGGYLIGFVLAAGLVGFLAGRGWDRNLGTSLAAMVVGNLAIYLLGATWLGFYVGFGRVLALGVLPFVVGDVLKIALGAAVLPLVWRLARRG